MTVNPLSAHSFPSFEASVRATWAPLLLRPIAGSYEQLVVGVAVANADGFHVELANALDRLACLFGADADGAINAVHVAADYLIQQLAEAGVTALSASGLAISSITLGEVRVGEGSSLEAIGASWMRQLSSLYRASLGVDEMEENLADLTVGPEPLGDPLPRLILRYVRERQEGFERFFAADLRENKHRRGRTHEVLIDFAGSRLVANFGTLRAGAISPSVTLLKRRLWDLKVERDGQANAAFHREHEMLVQTPRADDPQVTAKQRVNLDEALHALESQADQEQLRLLPLATVAEIGERILQAEAA